ncbi:hypothetical protein NGF19_21100 [Streptomyces sp. RY43-2]|uniref:Uncharacterized protein n=1 Tax=Streptomyces macrolidinus TaxID=2952607 RepID=A0ABT0ZI79_9ACTN|nr:hypothetical protein [Streptomyces macrolidinus]MCN9243251.1 hypothetical protein [Streptomyces macrolidinus]
MSDIKKDESVSEPDKNVHISDAKDNGTFKPDNVHISEAADDGTFTTDNVHISSEPK